MNFDTISNASVTQMLDAIATTSTFTEDIVVDTLGFTRALVILNVGLGVGTDETLALQFEGGDIDDGSDASDITGALISLADTDVSDARIGHIDLTKLTTRYLSCTGTIGGTSTPGFSVGINIVLYNAEDSASADGAAGYEFAI